MLDQLRQIAIFAKAIEHGSFRGAAKELRLSPSVISHHIAQLEDKLGIALIYRSTRQLTLTNDGEVLLKSAQGMLSAIEEGLSEISGHSKEPSGELRVTMSAVLSQSQLVDGIAGFKARYPKIRIELDFSDERRDLIRDGFDLAIRTAPSRGRAANRKSLFLSDRMLIAAPDYLRQMEPILHPKDLDKVAWIELTPARNVKNIVRNRSQVAQVSPPTTLGANDASAVYRLARSGAGVAIVPKFLAEADIAAGRMFIVLPDWKADPLETFAEWPVNAPKNGAARLLVEVLVHQAAKPLGASDAEIN